MLDRETLQEAQRVASSDALNAVLEELIKKYTGEWINSDPKDAQVREIAWHRVQAVQALRDELRSVAKSDDVAKWNRRLRGKTV